MASPFRIFRKYMKTLMVVFGVMIMFVFVVLDPMAAYLGGGRMSVDGESRQDADDIAVTWNGGSLTNAELDQLVQQRQIVNSFIRGVFTHGLQLAIQSGAEPRDLRVTPLIGVDKHEQGVERSVVRTKLFADAAREAGMQVSDDAIGAYLDELGGQRVTREEMSAMLQGVGGRNIPVQYIMSAIREEMLAHTFLNSYFYAFRTATPEQRYNDWLRVNDRIVIEAAPVPAESFLVDVSDPKPGELDAFFEKHKDREPLPDFEYFPGGGQMEFPSATPGFRIPRKIDVQYIEANYDEFLAKLESQVTEEEIVKYYEENKNPLFIKTDTTLIEEPAPPEQPGDTPAGAEAGDTTTGAEAPADDAAAPATEDTQPTTETEPATETNQTPTHSPAPSTGGQSNAAGESAPAPETASPSQDGEEQRPFTETTSDESADAQNSQPTADSTQDDAAPADGDQSFNAITAGVLSLTTVLQQAANPEPSSGETTGPESQGSPAATDAAASTASAEGGQPGAGDQSAEAAADEPSTSPAADAESTGSQTAAEAKPIEYQTLDEVRDTIRRTLAIARAPEQLDQLVGDLQRELNTGWTSYFSAQLSAQAEKRPAPAPPAALADLSQLAQKHGLKSAKTGPLSYFELRATPVGKSIDPESNNPLSDLVFGSKDVDPYQPISTMDTQTANRFVAMKTSDTPGRVPKLDEVRDEVVRAWKLQKAAERAEAFAAEQAQKAQTSGSALGEVLTGGVAGEVVRTDPFAMYTGGDIAYATTRQLEPYRLSEPDGIVAAGPEFMEKVFEMKVGDVAAVMNHDRSIAYIVRLVEHSLSPEELREAYLAEALIWPGNQIMASDRVQRSHQMLAEEIVSAYGVKWERVPDQLLEDEEVTDQEGMDQED